jgi:hypothetical protein
VKPVPLALTLRFGQHDCDATVGLLLLRLLPPAVCLTLAEWEFKPISVEYVP